MSYETELRELINKQAQVNFDKGYLQAVIDFYRLINSTHKTPDEIYHLLILKDARDRMRPYFKYLQR